MHTEPYREEVRRAKLRSINSEGPTLPTTRLLLALKLLLIAVSAAVLSPGMVLFIAIVLSPGTVAN